MSKKVAIAVALVQRLVPGSETREIENLKPGTVFTTDDKEFAALERIGGARVATKDEITLEEARREREGEPELNPTIFASVPKETAAEKKQREKNEAEAAKRAQAEAEAAEAARKAAEEEGL